VDAAVTATIDVLDAPTDVQSDVLEFLARLRGPTIFRVPGIDRTRARVVAGTLHGNEPSGVRAIHRVLLDRVQPAVDTWMFVGAVAAACAPPGFAHRMLPGHRDLNRCFRLPPFPDEDGRIAAAALLTLREAGPELVVDLHNNTGHNPAYGIGGAIDEAHLGVAALFTTNYVCSQLTLGTFTEAFAGIAPAVTIECGRAGDPAADETATLGLLRLLERDRIAPAGGDGMTLLVDPVRVCLHPWASLAFADEPAPGIDLTLDPAIDRHNFRALEPGTRLGWLRPEAPWPVFAIDPDGVDRSGALLEPVGTELRIRTSFVPMMATTDAFAARTDCLFYAARPRG